MNQQNNRRFYALLKEHGLQEEKANVALQATNGRSESSKDITDAEAVVLFEKFGFTYNAYTPSVKKPVDDKKQRQMGKLFFTFRKAGFYNELDKPDYGRIDNFCLTKTACKVCIKDMTAENVTAIITQLELIIKNWKK